MMKFKALLASLLLLIVLSACGSMNILQKADEKEEYPDEMNHSPSYRIDMEKYIKEKEKEGEVDSSIEKEDGHTIYVIKFLQGKIVERIPIGDNGYPIGYAVTVSDPQSKSNGHVENADFGIEAMGTFLNEAKLINQPLEELLTIDTTNFANYDIDSTHGITVNVDKKDNSLYLYLSYTYVTE